MKNKIKFLLSIIIISLFISTPTLREIIFYLFKINDHIIHNFKDILHIGLETIFMLILSIVLIIILIKLNNYLLSNKYLSKKINENLKEIKLNQLISIETLAELAEYHDNTTGNHLRRIREYVKILSIELKNNSKYSSYIKSKINYIEEIVTASMLHDIGKTSIPIEILLKPGKLSVSEFEKIKEHTIIAGEVLNKANNIYRKKTGKDSYLALARDIALYHHEKWNGTGYPDKRKEELIPLSARIVSICDMYDALVSERPYKNAWKHEDAVKEIISLKSISFDPIIIDVFILVQEKFNKIREKYK